MLPFAMRTTAIRLSTEKRHGALPNAWGEAAVRDHYGNAAALDPYDRTRSTQLASYSSEFTRRLRSYA